MVAGTLVAVLRQYCTTCCTTSSSDGHQQHRAVHMYMCYSDRITSRPLHMETLSRLIFGTDKICWPAYARLGE